MSYHCYTVDGYGIDVTPIENDPNLTVEKLEKLISKSPSLSRDYEEWKANGDGSPITDKNQILYDFVQDCSDYCDGGLASILQTIIWENEKMQLDIAWDFDGEHYLLYCPAYPWHMTVADLGVTQIHIYDAIQPYLDEITDIKVAYDYQSVENGG